MRCDRDLFVLRSRGWGESVRRGRGSPVDPRAGQAGGPREARSARAASHPLPASPAHRGTNARNLPGYTFEQTAGIPLKFPDSTCWTRRVTFRRRSLLPRRVLAATRKQCANDRRVRRRRVLLHHQSAWTKTVIARPCCTTIGGRAENDLIPETGGRDGQTR